MLAFKILKSKKFRIFLCVFAVFLVGLGSCLELYWIHPSQDISAFKIESRLNNASNNAASIKNKWLLHEKVERIAPLSLRTVAILEQFQTAIYLLQNDSIILWCGDKSSLDITPILLDTSQTLVNFDNRQIVVTRQADKNRLFALVVTLVDHGHVNHTIFDDENVTLLPNNSHIDNISPYWHKIDFGKHPFWAQSVTKITLPLTAYILGWLGILLLLILLCNLLKDYINSKNALTINILIGLFLIVFRLLLYFVPLGIFNGEYLPQYYPSAFYEFCFSPFNLLITVSFVLLQSYIYYSTLYRIRQHFSQQSKLSRYLFFLFNLLYRSVIFVYIHCSLVENIYNPAIGVNLFNIFSIGVSGFVVYLCCGLYFVSRLFQNNILDTPNFGRHFTFDVLFSIPIIIFLLWLLKDNLHGTWYIAIIYSLSFRAVGFLWHRMNRITVFCIASLITALYITSLVAIESTAATNAVADQYAQLIKSDNPQKSKIESSIYNGYSYALVNEHHITITNNNKTALWTIMPYIKSDTTIYIGSYVNRITPFKDKSLIVSYKYISYLDVLSLLCYIFFIIFSIGILVGLLLNVKLTTSSSHKLSLAVQIQLMTVGIVVFAVAIASIVSINYSQESIKVSNREVANNLLQTVQNSITNYEVNKVNPITWLENWYNFNGKALTDNIAVYGIDGRIIIGQPSYFHTHLLESSAIDYIKIAHNPCYSRTDLKLGQSYYTLYFPVHHKETLFGYIVISFIDPRSEPNSLPITEELLNMFIIVLFIIIWLSLLINYWVTRPLLVIQYALSRVNLMRKIPYRKKRSYNYEINVLIKMYNDMIETIKRNNMEIARIERHTVWQDMAKQIAHDIRNPLTPIQLKVQLLQRKISTGSLDIKQSTDETLELILTQLARINDVVDRFRELAYSTGATITELELSAVIINEVALYNHYDNVNVVFENKVQSEVVIYGDRTQIGRVIGNLCKNAIESVSGIDNGSVRVTLDILADKAVVEVLDNGSGINSDISHRIFDPSFTTKPHGSGLGLPICKRIIEEHNGDISFDNIATGGVIFRVILPLG